MDHQSASVEPSSVFVVWAHKDYRSTDAENAAWKEMVYDFVHLLDRYVDVDADIFHYTREGVDWSLFGPGAIQAADTVVMLGSRAFWERWRGENHPEEGAGSMREIDTLKGMFNRNQSEFQRKAVIVLLPGVSDELIPDELHRVTWFSVASIDEGGAEPILRRLLNKPRHTRRANKVMPDLPEYQPRQGGREAPPLPFGMPDDRANLLAAQRTGRGAGWDPLQGNSDEAVRGNGQPAENASELRMPRIVPVSFSAYDTLEAALARVGELFSQASGDLEPYGYTCRVRTPGDAVHVRVEAQGQAVCELRLRFDDSGFGGDRIAMSFAWPRITSSGMNGWITSVWDSDSREVKVKLNDLSVSGSEDVLLTADELYAVLWQKIVTFVEGRARR
ncbi:hypothetical protein [Amycolatopsis sp. cmx-8-4]|uniref:hypothetical protein n=1 Tax=Amycolatopsis sp. cmx-8-4 TaxID=2790947 RepID=UPI003979B6C7